MSTLSFGFERFYKKNSLHVPFIDDCGKFPTDCFIFHKQNTTLKLNSHFFLLRIEKKISAFESVNMALFLQSKKFQRLSLIYHSRTF